MGDAKDDRAVSEVVGTILVFGLLVMVISIVQVQAVPVWNEEVEFNHNQRVQNDLRQLDSAILNVMSTGVSRSVTVELGAAYPTRAILLNPPPMAGNLNTKSDLNDVPQEISVSNIRALDTETADYISGSIGPFDSRSIVYRPSYHEYGNPPTTIYEHSLLYNQFDDTAILLDEGTIIDGRRILLVSIAGNVSQGGSDSTSVAVNPSSTSTNAVRVTNTNNENLNITITTYLSESTVESDVLSNEYDPTGSNDSRYVRGITCLEHNQSTEPCDGRLRITLESDTEYELRMAKIGVGNSPGEVSPHYLATIRGDDSRITVDDRVDLVVEVRDRYNNPVSGVRVNVSDPSGTAGGDVTLSNATTDIDGRARFSYDPANAGQATIEVNISRTPMAREKVSFTVDVINATSTAPAYTVQWDMVQIESEEGVIECTESSCTYDRQADSSDEVLPLLANTSPSVIGADVDYSINDTSIASLDNEVTITDDAGEATTDLSTATDGDVTVYVSSGGSTDTLHLTILDSDVAPTIDTFAISDESNPGLGARFGIDWNVSDANGDLDTLNVSLIDNTGAVVDSVTPTVSGTTASGQSTLEDAGGYGDTYTIEITVTDTQMNSATDSESVTA